MSLLKYINFDIKYSQYCDVPPPLRKYLGEKVNKKGKKWNLKENKKTKRGGKKRRREMLRGFFAF